MTSTANPIAEQAPTVERIGSLEDLVALGVEWDAIQRRCPEKHVLMDHRWLCAWLRIFASDCQLHVLVLRRHGAVVGIVPLIISRSRELFPSREYHVHTGYDYRYTRVPAFLRWAPVRRLSFPLSVAMANRRAHCLFPEDDPALYEATVSYLESIASQWDLMVLEGIPQDSRQEELLLAALDSSSLRDDGRRYARPSMYAALPDSMDAFLASKRKHFRQRMRAACRQAEERFPDLKLCEYRGADVARGMQHIFELERRSWKMKADRERTYHIRQTDDLRRFHAEVAEAFAATDGSVVLTMEIGRQPVAGIYCVERDSVLAAIITFMDEQYSRKVTTAPLFRRMVEMCIERGITELDFNGKTDNIARWANGTRHSSRLFRYNRQPYSTFLWGIASAAQRANLAIKALKERGGARPEKVS